MITKPSLNFLLAKIRACRLCQKHLPLGPRPVLRASITARLLIVGQAPGTKVHNTGIPFNDPSGDRLSDWMGIDHKIFYDESRIAIVPMGLCYPGVNKNGGDNPPRLECAVLWHPQILPQLGALKLILLVGSFAQKFYFRERNKPTLTETVQAWREYLPRFLPLPHPSWRNNAWLHRNPWFTKEVLPELRKQVTMALSIKGD